MEKTFWLNPYQHTLDATVVGIQNNEVLLDKTIAFSFSGGQESDMAFLNDVPVLSSRMDGNLIYYTVPDSSPFQVGQQVIQTIDWPRRYKLMRLHFAAELILELVTQKFHMEKVGAHIAEHKARIDFKRDENISSIFDAILTDYNAIIDANYPIEKGYMDVATQRRFWKIEGFAQVPCGGTHVNSTQEVGYVRLKRVRPGKGVERIEIYLLEPDFIP